MPEPLRVLIVDDNQEVRHQLVEIVARSGYIVIQAADGVEAIPLVEAGQADILITDLALPGSHGITLMQHAAERNAPLPVILTTTTETLDSAIKALRLGAFDYLLKPFHTPLVEAALRRAEAAVLCVRAEAERDLFRAVLNAAGDGIVVLDPQGVVLFANPAAALLFDVPQEQALGQSIATLLCRNAKGITLQDATGATLAKYAARLASPEPLEPSTLALSAPEKRVFESHRTSLHAPSGELRAYLLLWRDITQEKEAERWRGQMGHLIVHDLRNPMSLVRVGIEAAQMFLPPETNADALQGLSLALQGVNQLERKSAILLAVHHIENGDQALHLALLSLATIIEAVQAFYRFELQERHIVLAVNVAPDLPLVCADADLLEWALGDLVYNAIRYSPSQGRIEIAAEPQREGVAITISDEGPGVPPEDQAHIFDRFRQTDALDGQRSSGLRLYFGRLVVEAHGGTISIESGKGRGCAFRLWLPLYPNRIRAPEQPPQAAGAQESNAQQHKVV